MINLVFVGIGLLLAYNLGAWVTEYRYERIIEEKEKFYSLMLGSLRKQLQKRSEEE